MDAFAGEDEDSAKLFATLGFVRDGLSPALQRLLIPLALHERFVDARLLKVIAGQVGDSPGTAEVDQLLNALGMAGLLNQHNQAIHELHPGLAPLLAAHGVE